MGAAAVVLVTAGLAAWLVLVSRPEVSRYEAGLSAIQDSHNAMLNQETGVRGFVSTGDPRFLEAYDLGREQVVVADRKLLPLARDPLLSAGVVDLHVAQHRWMEGWAVPGIAATRARPAVPGTVELRNQLTAGKVLFDSYRNTRRDLSAAAAASLDVHRRNQDLTIMAASGLAVTVSIGILLAAHRRRTVLRRDLLTPVGALTTGLADVRAGRYDRTIATRGPAELMEIVGGFNRMISALDEGRQLAEQQQGHVEEQSQRLRTILRMVREIGGSLNLKYVLQSVVEGAASVTSAQRVTVWLMNDHEASLMPVRDSHAPIQDGYEPLDLGTGLVGRAAKYGRTTRAGAQDEESENGRIAIPLIVGARVVGVLELELPDDEAAVTDDQIEVLETLSIHSAAAIEAARLHDATSHASEHDALTRLANRRRMEADLALECERSMRYGQPVSLIMLDLDHFKRVNDTYGHARGDEVLQGCAETITETLRATDTAYRYGGEELVVIARDSDAEGTFGLAERIRASIQRRFEQPGESGVTASLGIASVPSHAASPKALVEAADTALYVSKHAGRNRVTIATVPGAGNHDHRPALPVLATPAEVG